METHDTVDRLPIGNPQPGIRWFSRYGCVVEGDDVNRVFIGDTLLAQYDPHDRDLGPRSIALVMLANVPNMHLGHLAAAFEISDEQLRRIRRAVETEGYGAVLTRARGCALRDEIAPAKIRELHALFKEGWNPTDATRRQRRRGHVSRSTVSRERQRWQRARETAQGAIGATPVVPMEVQQVLLDDAATAVRPGEASLPTFVQAVASAMDEHHALDNATGAIGNGSVNMVATVVGDESAARADATHGAMTKRDREHAQEAVTEGMQVAHAFAVDAIAEATNTEGTIAAPEPAIVGDMVAETVAEAFPDQAGNPTNVLADDGVTTDAVVTEQTIADITALALPGASAAAL